MLTYTIASETTVAEEKVEHMSVMYAGTYALIEPVSPMCKAWVDAHVRIEDWQWFGASERKFVADPRMARDIMESFDAYLKEE